MSVGATGALQRVAAIQQLATSIGGTPAGGFQTALAAAQSAGATTTATTVTGTTTGAAVTGMPYATEINAAATKYGLDPALLAGLVKQESGFNPTARSAAGAQGLTQLMPATARSLGVVDATDPAQALEGGGKYLREQLDRFGGDESLALAAYNAGPGAVERFGGVPPYSETQAYVKHVLANRDALQAASAPTLGVSALGLSESSSSGTYGTSSSLNYPTT